LITWDADMPSFPPRTTFYNLAQSSDAEKWTKQLQPSSFRAMNATASYVAYDGTFRCLYVMGMQDRTVTPELAEGYVRQEGARFEVLRVQADHVMMVSQPGAVAGIVRRFAGEDV
jgi:hypothetical protein